MVLENEAGKQRLEKLYFLQLKPGPDYRCNPANKYSELDKFSHSTNLPEQKACKQTGVRRLF
jgi:hypothetical protein